MMIKMVELEPPAMPGAPPMIGVALAEPPSAATAEFGFSKVLVNVALWSGDVPGDEKAKTVFALVEAVLVACCASEPEAEYPSAMLPFKSRAMPY